MQSIRYHETGRTFNNRNISPKVSYNLPICSFFRKPNQNAIFLVVTLWCSITSLSSVLLINFLTNIKNIYCSVLKTFLILIFIMFIQSVRVQALLIRQSGDTETN